MDEIRTKLTGAGVTADGIELLNKQGMLDAELLADSTATELQSGCGINMGDAKRVKRAFPSVAATPALTTPPTAAPGTIEVVLKASDRDSDETVLNGVKNKDQGALEEARRRFARVYVIADDGTLDVKATLAAIKFFSKHGGQERFANTAGSSVRVVTLDELFREEEELNPLTLHILVPGEPMSKLTTDQRLLIAFGIVNGSITSRADEDQVIDAVIRKTSRWEIVQTDLDQARAGETDLYRQAKARCKRKSGEQSATSGGASHHGGGGNLFDYASPFGGDLVSRGAATLPAGGDLSSRSGSLADTLRVLNGGLPRLTPVQRRDIIEALVDAFDAGSLARLASYHLGRPLENITSGGTFPDKVASVVAWAERNDKLEALLRGARELNRGNTELKIVCSQFGIF